MLSTVNTTTDTNSFSILINIETQTQIQNDTCKQTCITFEYLWYFIGYFITYLIGGIVLLLLISIITCVILILPVLDLYIATTQHNCVLQHNQYVNLTFQQWLILLAVSYLTTLIIVLCHKTLIIITNDEQKQTLLFKYVRTMFGIINWTSILASFSLMIAGIVLVKSNTANINICEPWISIFLEADVSIFANFCYQLTLLIISVLCSF